MKTKELKKILKILDKVDRMMTLYTNNFDSGERYRNFNRIDTLLINDLGEVRRLLLKLSTSKIDPEPKNKKKKSKIKSKKRFEKIIE